MVIDIDDFVMDFLLTLYGTCRSDASIQPGERDAMWAASDAGYITQDIDVVGNLVYRLTDTGRTVASAGKHAIDHQRKKYAEQQAEREHEEVKQEIREERQEAKRFKHNLVIALLNFALGIISGVLIQRFAHIL